MVVWQDRQRHSKLPWSNGAPPSASGTRWWHPKAILMPHLRHRQPAASKQAFRATGRRGGQRVGPGRHAATLSLHQRHGESRNAYSGCHSAGLRVRERKRWVTCPSCGERRNSHAARAGNEDDSDKVTVECARWPQVGDRLRGGPARRPLVGRASPCLGRRLVQRRLSGIPAASANAIDTPRE